MARKCTQIEEFDPERIRPLPDQPRVRFRGIKELAGSIKAVGQTCPGIVTPLIGVKDFDAQLVDGERRLRACRLAGLPFRAEVRPIPDATALEELFTVSFAANFGKQHHDAIEIAHGLARMQKAGKTIEQLCAIAGHSTAWVSGHLQLLKLHPSVQKMLLPPEGKKNIRTGRATAGKLNRATALLLAPLDESKQITLARKITADGGMSLACARRLVFNARSAAGEENVRSGTSGAKRSITTVESILDDFADRIGIYLDMPPAELNTLIDGVDHRTKRLLVESMEDAAASLNGLAEAVGKRLPKLVAGAVR